MTKEEQLEYLESLKSKANLYNITFSANIGAKALEAKIKEYESELDEVEEVKPVAKKATKAVSPAIINKAKTLALMEQRKVIVSDNDNKYQEEPTITVGISNAIFEITKVIPKDVPFYVEQCLINTLLDIKYTKHINVRDNNGKTTGNKMPVEAKRFVIDYID